MCEVYSANIVITTYHTVSAEWNSNRDREVSVLFAVHWRRIVLDEGEYIPRLRMWPRDGASGQMVLSMSCSNVEYEADLPLRQAHFIRNEKSRMSRAVCELNSEARWAVTGTPIQVSIYSKVLHVMNRAESFENRLDDLATLLKFIQAYPYTDTKQFRADISSLWKAGEDEKAVNRLKYLSASLILRRPKGTISLPPRRDVQYPVDFSTGERQAYEEIRNRAIVKINEALQSGSEPTKAGAYVNVLQQIESLRLTCDRGPALPHQAPRAGGRNGRVKSVGVGRATGI